MLDFINIVFGRCVFRPMQNCWSVGPNYTSISRQGIAVLVSKQISDGFNRSISIKTPILDIPRVEGFGVPFLRDWIKNHV